MNHITKAYLGFPGITNPECPLGSSAITIDYDFKTRKVLLAYQKKKKKQNHQKNNTCSKHKIKLFSKMG